MAISRSKRLGRFANSLTEDGQIEGLDARLDTMEAGELLVVSSNIDAVPGGKYFVETASGEKTVKLPPAPSDGNVVRVWRDGENNITIDRNGSTIVGVAENLVLDEDKRVWTLTYAGGTWRANVGAFA